MSIQHDRDLRSAHIDYKRNRDQTAKWEHGARGLHIAESGPLREGTAVESFRPCKPLVRYWVMPNNNIQKPFRGNRTNMPASRHRETSQALKELQDSRKMTTSDILAQAPPTKPSTESAEPATPTLDVPADLVYSFDHNSPQTTLTLDAFIKTPSARSTEKMIKNEYEVLDANGEAVHGRKARQVLREAAAISSSSPVTKPKLIEVVDEDDFELV